VALSVVAAVALGLWFYLESRHRVSTDDAHVEGSVVIVSARVSGPVARVHVRDNQEVWAGNLLVELDPRDFEVRVQHAQAALAMTRAEERAARTEVPLTRESVANRVLQAGSTVRALRLAVDVARAEAEEARARLESRRAAILAARAETAVAESGLDRARVDLERASRLVKQGLIAVQEHDVAQFAHRAATATLEAGRRRLAQAEQEAEQVLAEVRRRELGVRQAERRAEEAEALLAEAETQRAQVPVKEATAGRAAASREQATAELAAAELDLEKTRVLAPVDGVVAKKSVEPGQLVQPGQPLLAVVPLEGLWVVANFKETQLARVRPGQRATIRIDTFPDRVFEGTVDSISAGTGSRFSLLPPENATGNWVKVVQRIPVKITLDGYRANPHVLRAGMSATVTVELR
jgi:membrane fusion protein (multidrug efflux system)